MRAMLMAVLVATAVPACSPQPANLSGEWVGENYQCPVGTLHREKIKVTDTGAAIEAIKLGGDDCVPAGQVTFKGSREKLSCIVGLPGNPASGEVAGSIKVVSANSFEACSVTFVRE